MNYKKQKGAVALEYILVTTFATLLSLAVIGVVSKFANNKLKSISQKVGLPASDLSINLFGE